MNSKQFERYLRAQGIEVTSKRRTGHKKLFNPANSRHSVLPMHGGNRELGTGLIEAILKQLGLK